MCIRYAHRPLFLQGPFFIAGNAAFSVAPMTFTRTRIAPTPSGYLHRGNALSFLLTARRAREAGARLLLRIDDMDRDRLRPEYVQDVFDTLAFLEIRPDEGPVNALDFEAHWSQRHRLPLYEAALRQLRESGRLFACTCSRAALLQAHPDGIYTGTCRHKGLPLDTPGAAWRLRTDATAPLRVQLPGGAFRTAPLPENQTDFIVRKKDGFPAYQLCSLVDDGHFGVDYIVRGEDLWDSTLAQLYLARVLGDEAFAACTFEHHPLLLDASGGKLSKSAGAASIRHFRAAGGTLEELIRSTGSGLYP
ncbi:MAG: tRNA glutamyl-Q synthetase [Chitinophagaceae bacterium]|nr:MAG: tRNA glutamyl-Q synthetase [Chitinophagaceae bacterium]